MRRRHELLPRLLLVALAVTAAFLLAELGLRLTERPAGGNLDASLRQSAQTPLGGGRSRFSLMGLVQPSSHPDVVYELKPGLVGTFRDRPLRVNAHGMRGLEVTRTKPPGTFRIAGLGDSVMFGWGVGEGEPYLQLLEQRLAQEYPGRRFECLNFAVPGYNAAMEAATFEHRAAAFDPDVVVVHFVHNDLGLPHFMQPASAERRSRLRLLTLVRERFGDGVASDRRRSLLPRHDTAESVARREEARAHYQHMVGEEGYRAAMARLAQATRERGIPVVLLTLERGRRAAAPAREAAHEHGFRYLDATAVFERHLAEHGLARSDWNGTFTIPGDGHPTPLGHVLYAEALLVELARGLLPGTAVAGASAEEAP